VCAEAVTLVPTSGPSLPPGAHSPRISTNTADANTAGTDAAGLTVATLIETQPPPILGMR
jgi:hypothetical protein